MSIDDIKNQLDELIEKSQSALNAIEKQQWDNFTAIEADRQKIFEKMKTLDLAKDTQLIETIQAIMAMNQKILSQTLNHHDEIKRELSHTRKKQSVDKAYQQ